MFAWLKRLFGGQPVPQEPALAKQARDPDPDVRRQAAVALGTVGDIGAPDVLLALLQDSHTAVREAARESLRQHCLGALPALLRGLNHPAVEVATVSAELLGELRCASAVQPLLVALKFSARPVQVAARRGLIALGPVAVPALEAAREDPQPWVRQQIADILAALGRQGQGSAG